MKPGWVSPKFLALVVLALISGASISARAATIQIGVENLEFAPANATGKVGDTIEWVNKDMLAHTATARDGDWDVMLPPKKSATLVLKKAGTIEYSCRFHPNMKATLTVAP